MLQCVFNLQLIVYTFFFNLFLQQVEPNSVLKNVIGVSLTVIIVSICTYYILRHLESIYAKKYGKPYFVHLYFRYKKLDKEKLSILEQHSFYQHLDLRRKRFFSHRIAKFLEHTAFVGRDGLIVEDFMQMQIAIMVTQMTFGMRHYLLSYLKTIIIYPESFFSVLNQSQNLGEFNPHSKVLAISWQDFQKGNQHKDDGKSLGVHEITHAIHYNSIRNSNISSEIFYDTFLLLEEYLGKVEIRNKIVESKILREYAFTDKFEFIAVLVEVFIESPSELEANFPQIYKYVAQMLNFRYFDTKS